MRKFFSFLVILGVTLGFWSGAFAKELKIGYVDFFKIYNDYEKTKEYDKMIEAKKDGKEKELKKKVEEIEKLQGKISLLKEKEKEKEKENLAKAAKEFETLRRESFIDLKKERDEKMKEIVQDIENVIKEYAKKNEFDLILNENSVLHGDKTMDITDQIMKLVNEDAKK